jgi:hypothetical protein
VSNTSLKEGNCVTALWLSRFSQGGGVQTLAERRVAQVTGCAAKTCSLFHSLLIKQALDLKLQPRDGTLAALSPVLKSLGLLEEVWRMAECDHLHTSRMLSEEKQSRRTLRLNRGCRDCCLPNGSAAGGPDFSEAVYMG